MWLNAVSWRYQCVSVVHALWRGKLFHQHLFCLQLCQVGYILSLMLPVPVALCTFVAHHTDNTYCWSASQACALCDLHLTLCKAWVTIYVVLVHNHERQLRLTNTGHMCTAAFLATG